MDFGVDAVHSDILIAGVFDDLHDVHSVIAFSRIQLVFVFPQSEETIRHNIFGGRFISYIGICQQLIGFDVGKKCLPSSSNVKSIAVDVAVISIIEKQR